MTVGIVVVGHSRDIAVAARDFALTMVPHKDSVVIDIAAGLLEGESWVIGTDAMMIADSITSVASHCDDVLVLMDIGSSVMSAQMALEFVDTDIAKRTTLCDAPLVEGLVTAVAAAAAKAPLDKVISAAHHSIQVKAHAIGSDDVINTTDTATNPGTSSQKTDSTNSGRTTNNSADNSATPPDAVSEIRILDPHGMHARPAAALANAMAQRPETIRVSNRRVHSKFIDGSSMIELLMLDAAAGDSLTFHAWGDEAEEALDLAAEVLESFAKATQEAQLEASVTQEQKEEKESNPTLEISDDEIVIGSAYWLNSSVDTSQYQGTHESSTESQRLQKALEMAEKLVLSQAEELMESDTGTSQTPGNDTTHNSALMLQAQAALLRDTALWSPIFTTITTVTNDVHSKDTVRTNAIEATASHITNIAQQFDALTDPYLRQRAHDIRAVGLLIQMALMAIDGNCNFEELVTTDVVRAKPDAESVLFLERLSVLRATRLDPSAHKGIVLVHGSATSHAVLVARGRGIPIVCAGEEALEVTDGQLVAIDPRLNLFDFDLSDTSVLQNWEERKKQRARETKLATERRFQAAITLDGTRIPVMCNVASIHDAKLGREAGAEGSGLVRTESLFSSRTTAPSIEEQADIFTRIARILGGPITVRLWDCGADKPLKFMPQNSEQNPFLGVRGIRLLRRYRQLLVDQLRAGLRVKAAGIDLDMMASMITFPAEMEFVRSCLDEAKRLEGDNGQLDLKLGMMVEVPAAALSIADFAHVADFASIGTNDLSQYVLAADRLNEEVWPTTSLKSRYPLDDPVIKLITRIAREAPMPVAVCGDMASNVAFVPDLVQCGVTKLSARPTMVPLIKQKVRDYLG